MKIIMKMKLIIKVPRGTRWNGKARWCHGLSLQLGYEPDSPRDDWRASVAEAPKSIAAKVRPSPRAGGICGVTCDPCAWPSVRYQGVGLQGTSGLAYRGTSGLAYRGHVTHVPGPVCATRGLAYRGTRGLAYRGTSGLAYRGTSGLAYRGTFVKAGNTKEDTFSLSRHAVPSEFPLLYGVTKRRTPFSRVTCLRGEGEGGELASRCTLCQVL
jgi:hypothetical protein